MTPTETKESFLRRCILHPFAFALFPILSLYSRNFGQVYPESVLTSSILVLAITSLLFFLLRRLLPQPQLAGLLTSFFLLFLFCYGFFSTFILKLKFGDFVFLRNMHRIPLYTGLCLLLGYAVFKLYQRWPGLTKFLNVISLCLVVVSLFTLGWFSLFGRDPESPLLAGTEKDELPNSLDNDGSPDIYYIILDGYGSADVLKKYFDYDNTAFTGYLRSKGFFLPANPRSNYGITLLSVGSSLSMEYLTESTCRHAENKVRPFVEAKGYEYIGFSSMKPRLTGRGRAGISWRSLLQNEFSLQLLRTTVLDPVALRFNIYAYTVRNNILACFETLKAIPEKPGKKFIFAHLLCPHPPYVFKADGGSPRVSLSEANLSLYRTPWDDKDAYLQQVRYLNSKVIDLVDTLLQKSRVPPVIILQGDHGPKLTVPNLNTAVDMHMRILNAYFLPGNGRSSLYDTITPVNSLRTIFDQYLHAGLPLLEDKCYFSTFEKPFVLSNVTAQLSK